jgi:hypothetical protein
VCGVLRDEDIAKAPESDVQLAARHGLLVETKREADLLLLSVHQRGKEYVFLEILDHLFCARIEWANRRRATWESLKASLTRLTDPKSSVAASMLDDVECRAAPRPTTCWEISCGVAKQLSGLLR